MNNIFHTPELVSEITKQLGFKLSASGKIDQCSFGLSCKAVWEVAVAEVWRSVFGVNCFCRLLPDDIVACVTNADKVVLPRPLEESEWQHLSKYSQRVQHIRLSERGSGRVDSRRHSSLLAAVLASLPEGMNLYPLLRSFECQSYFKNEDFVSAAICFFRMPLAKLEVTLSGGMTQAGLEKRALDSIGPHPGLATLRSDWDLLSEGVQKQYDDHERERVIGNVILRLRHLKELDIPVCVIDGQSFALAKAGSLLGLQKLSVSMDNSRAAAPSSIVPAFPSLQALAIRADFTKQTVGHLEQLLESVISTSLAQVRLSSCENLIVAGKALQIVGRKWSSSLLRLSLVLGIWSNGYTGKVQRFDAVLPLVQCHSLQELRIESIDPLDVLDTHYDTISSAWPELRRLCIYDQTCKESTRGPRTSKTSRQSLVYLAERCRELRSLSISVNFDKGASVKAPKAGTQSSRLQDFHSIWSTSTKTRSTVAFIRATFPLLRSFDALNVGGYDYTDDGKNRGMDDVMYELELAEIGDDV